MFGLGVGEILVILVIALVFIGPKKLPELAKTLGRGFSEFQNAMKGINTTIQNPTQNPPPTQHPQAQPPLTASVPEKKEQYVDDHVYVDDPPHDQNLPEDEQDFLVEEKIKAHSDKKPS